MASREIPCPSCAAPVFSDDFMCGNCDLILNATAASGAYRVKESTIVRALLSVAPSKHAPGAGAPAERPDYPKGERDMTVVAAAPMDRNTYPRVIADLDIALAPLHAFEAYVVSFLNGEQAAPDIAKAAKLKQVELEAVLRSLVERNLVELEVRKPEVAAPAQDKEAPATVEVRPAPAEFTQPTPKAPRPEKPARSRAGDEPKAAPLPVPVGAPAAAAVEPKALPLPVPEVAPAAVAAESKAPPLPVPVVAPAAAAAEPKAPPISVPAETPAAASAPPPPVLVAGPGALRAAERAGLLPPSAPSPSQPEPPSPPTRPATPPAASPAPRAPARPPTAPHGFKVIPVSQIAAPAHAALAPPIRTVPIRPPPPAPIERPESILQKAISLEQSGDVDGAIKVLERAISRFKKPGPLYNKLAVIVLNQGKDYSRSEELLKKALEHEPDNAVYQQNLFKVVALAATSDNKKRSGGFFARLRGKG